jgi:hypothetical protein
LTRIQIRLFGTDLDPYRFKEVMYPKAVLFYVLTLFSLSVSPTGPNQKVHFVKFSIPVNFVVLLEQLTDPDPQYFLTDCVNIALDEI